MLAKSQTNNDVVMLHKGHTEHVSLLKHCSLCLSLCLHDLGFIFITLFRNSVIFYPTAHSGNTDSGALS